MLITCSSHEDRCLGVPSRLEGWTPEVVVVFHYDDENPKREEHHQAMLTVFRNIGAKTVELEFTEASAVQSLAGNINHLRELIQTYPEHSIVLDITVFTKRHLLMMLRWLDDVGKWDGLILLYTEPEDYDVSEHVPLSFGLRAMEQIPGFPACPDTSRALHLVLFLGYEGDRALASYDHVQPMRTTLVIPHPPFRKEWEGRVQVLNRELLALVSDDAVVFTDAVDPDSTMEALVEVFGTGQRHKDYAKVICPIGTKPQTVGIYSFLRTCEDPPAIVYAAPLRHNHRFFSHGLGSSWILKLT